MLPMHDTGISPVHQPADRTQALHASWSSCDPVLWLPAAL